MIIMSTALVIVWQVAAQLVPIPSPSDGFSVPSRPEIVASLEMVVHHEIPALHIQ